MFPEGTFNEEKDYLATKVPDLYIVPEEHLIDLPYKQLYNYLMQKALIAVFGNGEFPLIRMATENEMAIMKTELRKAIDEAFPDKDDGE